MSIKLYLIVRKNFTAIRETNKSVLLSLLYLFFIFYLNNQEIIDRKYNILIYKQLKVFLNLIL